MTVEEDSEKTLHSVMAMWTDEDNANNKGVEKGNDNELKNCLSASAGEEEEGYSSDMDLSFSVGDGQEMCERRATKKTALWMTIGAGKVKMKRVAVREMELEREGILGRRGMTVLVVWILAQ